MEKISRTQALQCNWAWASVQRQKAFEPDKLNKNRQKGLSKLSDINQWDAKLNKSNILMN